MTRRSILGLVLLTLISGGCRPAGEPRELDTEDVSGPIDAELSYVEDTQAVQRAPELSGVLPSDFPEDFPIFKPATVVDFGELGDERYYVTLFTPESRASVERLINGAAPRSGWSLQSASPEAGEFVFRSRGRTVVTRMSNEVGGTEIRLEY